MRPVRMRRTSRARWPIRSGCALSSGWPSGERSVSDLSRDVGCQVPNMSQHLAVLRSAGLVASRREGSTVFYRLVDDRVLDAYRLLQQVAG